MSPNTKKNHLLLLAGIVVFPFFLAEAARSINEAGFLPTPISIGTLKAMKVVAIILSFIAFVTPWLIYKDVIPFHPKQRTTSVRINPEYVVLIYGYLFLFSPVIYGLVLFFLGMSIAEFYYYASVSAAGILVWGLLNFKDSTKT